MASNTSINDNFSNKLDNEKDVFRKRLLESVDYWYYEMKVNVIPIRMKDKRPNIEEWTPYKNMRIPQDK